MHSFILSCLSPDPKLVTEEPVTTRKRRRRIVIDSDSDVDKEENTNPATLESTTEKFEMTSNDISKYHNSGDSSSSNESDDGCKINRPRFRINDSSCDDNDTDDDVDERNDGKELYDCDFNEFNDAGGNDHMHCEQSSIISEHDDLLGEECYDVDAQYEPPEEDSDYDCDEDGWNSSHYNSPSFPSTPKRCFKF